MALIAKSRVSHDGQVFETGEVIEGITADQAQALIDAGAAEHDNGDKLPEKKEKEVKAPKTEEKKREYKITNSKQQLLDYAKSKEIEIDETLTRDEIYHKLIEIEG